MRHILKTIQSLFFTVLNYFLLAFGNILVVLGCLLTNMYIPVIATVPMLIIGLIATFSGGHGVAVVLGVFLFLIVLGFILPLISSAYQIILMIFSSAGSLISNIGQRCFSAYKNNDFLIDRNKTFAPKIARLFYVPYFILNILHSASFLLLRGIWILSILFSIGSIGYCIYSYSVDFSDSFATLMLSRLETFATEAPWGNYVLGIMLILTILGTLIKISLDIKLEIETIYFGTDS